MDLISIVMTVWRHKLATIPIILLTALGSFYVIAVKAPTYEAESSLLLLLPPTGPTAAQVAKHPSLGKINPNNPYVTFGDLAVVADAVINVVTSDTAETALVRAGADPQYQLALSTDTDSPPIIQITGIAPTPQEAILSANLVTTATENDLRQLQQSQGVNSFYMIKSTQLVSPNQASEALSGKLRTLIAVLGLGVLLLFIVISAAEVLGKRRPRRADRPRSARADEPPRTRAREDRRRTAVLPEHASSGRQRHPEPEPSRSSASRPVAVPETDPGMLDHPPL